MKRYILIGMLLSISLLGASCAKNASQGTKEQSTGTNTTKTLVSRTDLYLFSGVDDRSFEGEGFFASLSTGETIFVYSRFMDDPSGIVAIQRELAATAHGQGGNITYNNGKEANAYFASKAELGIENRISNFSDYETAIPNLRSKGSIQKATFVYMKDISATPISVVILGKDITSVNDMTETTGGSVYVITINSSNGNPLSVVVATKDGDVAKNRLEEFKNMVTKEVVGTDKKIVAKNVSYQDVIYTLDGVRTGWSTFLDSVSIE